MLFFLNTKPRETQTPWARFTCSKKNIIHRRQSKRSYLLKKFADIVCLFEATSLQRLKHHTGTSETAGKPTRSEDTGNSRDVSNRRGASNSRNGRNS
jgi:hypothetical protein